MADLSGWGALGAALGGAGNTQAAYQRGQVNAARVAELLSQAQIKRDQVLARQDLESKLTAAGNAPDQAGLLATALRGGFNPKEISGYTGDLQEQGFRGDAVQRALAGDWNGANANLAGVASGPVALAAVEGQNLINNRYLAGGGGISTTEQGQAGIKADAARAAASYASANSSNAAAQAALGRLGIAQQQFALERAGQWNPSGRVAGASGGAGAAAAPGKLTEGQSKDVLYFTRGNEANKLLQTLGGNLTAGGGQQGAIRGSLDAVLRGLPGVGDSAAVNGLVSSERQQAEQAGSEFLASVLRKDTGAAITKEEFSTYGRMYLPQPGDSEQTLAQKARAREIALGAIKASMGSAASAIPTISPSGGSAVQAMGGPQPGTVQDGYRFRGGNPADPNAWERL